MKKNDIILPTNRDMVSILGRDFFEEEVRCDFVVNEKMKRIWAVEIDMYFEIARVCEKYGLKYFAYAGTVLGAIRHKGFIPWDDDMDVCMPRKDYEEFLKVAPNEIREPYMIQTPYTDPNYFITFARIVNKRTSFIYELLHHSGMTLGIPVDIFPIDDCDVDTIEKDIELIRTSATRCAAYIHRNDTDKMNKERYDQWVQFMTDAPLREWENIQEIAQKKCDSDYCSLKVFLPRNPEYNKPMKKSWFASTVKVSFEKVEICIPSGYDEILKMIYGNYMEYPPKENRGNWHHDSIIDASKSYLEYI